MTRHVPAVLAALALAACGTEANQDTFAQALPTAQAAGATTIAGPPQILKGKPNLITVVGANAGGQAALVVGTPGNFCPPQLGGLCLSVNPAVTLFSAVNAAGEASFNVQPPANLGLGNIRFQVGSIGGGAAPVVSNILDLPAVCGFAAPIASFPSNGHGGIRPGEALSFTFAEAEASRSVYATQAAGGVLTPVGGANTTISADGRTATLTPGTLSPNTAYTLFALNPCNQITRVNFVTGNANAVGGYNMVGNDLVLSLDNITINEPASIASLAAPLIADFDDSLVLTVVNWDGSDETMDLRLATLVDTSVPADGINDEQDVCSTTEVQPDIPFDDDPNFGASIDELAGIIQDATLTGTVTAGGTSVTNVNLTAYIDALEVATQLGFGSTFLLCLAVIADGGCVPCPTGGGDCIYVDADGVEAAPWGGPPMVDISEAEVLANPACTVP